MRHRDCQNPSGKERVKVVPNKDANNSSKTIDEEEDSESDSSQLVLIVTIAAVVGGLTALAIALLIVCMVRKLKQIVRSREVSLKRSEYQQEIVSSRNREYSSGTYDNEDLVSTLPMNGIQTRITFDAERNSVKVYNDKYGTYTSHEAQPEFESTTAEVQHHYMDMSKQPEYVAMTSTAAPSAPDLDNG